MRYLLLFGLIHRQAYLMLPGLVILVGSGLGLPAPAHAQSFAGPATYAAGSGPQGIASADVNADGWTDLLIADSGTNTVGVLLNQAARPGAFAATPVTFPTRGTYPVALATGDLNGDKYPDVVLVNETSSSVSILLNAAGPALFTPATTYASGPMLPRGVALGDVNGDGLLDIVLTATASNKIGVLLNSPARPGTFQAALTYRSGGNHPEGLALGDLNGDGQLDIVVSNQASSSVGVLLNSAKSPGKFAAPATYASGGSLPRGLALGDVNQDSLLDVVVTNAATGTVSTLLNSASLPGTLRPATTYASGATGPVGLAVGDVTGDKAADLVVADYRAKTGTTLLVLRHAVTGAGAYVTPGKTYESGGDGPHDVLVRDFNGDGRLDMATTNFGSNTVGVLLNTSKH